MVRLHTRTFRRFSLVLLPLLLLALALPSGAAARLADAPATSAAPAVSAGPGAADPQMQSLVAALQQAGLKPTSASSATQPAPPVDSPWQRDPTRSGKQSSGAAPQTLDGPSRAAPAPNIAPDMAGRAQAPSAVPQAGVNCTQLFVDPRFDDPTADPPIWRVYRQVVYFTDAFTDVAEFTPYSYLMVENDAQAGYPLVDNVREDRNGDGQTEDIDAFGQEIAVPTDAYSLTISFDFRYAPGTTSNDDRLYIDFYFADPDSTAPLENLQLINSFFLNAPTYDDDAWHNVPLDLGAIDPASLAAMRGQNVVVVLRTYNNNPITSPNQIVYIDNAAAESCPYGRIGGQVTQAGVPDLTSASLYLIHLLPGSFVNLTEIRRVHPDASGNYQFDTVAPIPTNHSYQVWFINDNDDPSRLHVAIGDSFVGFTQGQEVVSNFNLTNMALISPEPDTAVLTRPLVTFTWAGRGPDGAHLDGDRYAFCLTDAANSSRRFCLPTLLNEPRAAVPPQIFQSPQFSFFRYNQRYLWSVAVVGSGVTTQTLDLNNIGYANAMNAVTFLETPIRLPSGRIQVGGNVPNAGSTADWTVMIYMAGDNRLGDPGRYAHPTAGLMHQFDDLKQLAASAPNVHLVTLTDFYGKTGTQFCHLKPNRTQACEELGEQDTASPAVLTDFINRALERFPAQHTMLVISSPAHAIAGIAPDESTAFGARMYPHQIRQALADANLSAPDRKLDVLFYNASLLGSLEAVADASGFADYLVAGANEVWSDNIYTGLLGLLTNAGTKDSPASVAAGIVDAYQQMVQARGDLFVSLAAFDLSKVGAVNTALSDLGSALDAQLHALPYVIPAELSTARNTVQRYDSSGDWLLGNDDAFVDLWHLGTLLSSSVDPATATSANALVSAVDALILNSHQASGTNANGDAVDLSNASGLSGFFPNGIDSGDQLAFVHLYTSTPIYEAFRSGTQWDEFTRDYNHWASILRRGPGGAGTAGVPVSGEVPSDKMYLPLTVR